MSTCWRFLFSAFNFLVRVVNPFVHRGNAFHAERPKGIFSLCSEVTYLCMHLKLAILGWVGSNYLSPFMSLMDIGPLLSWMFTTLSRLLPLSWSRDVQLDADAPLPISSTMEIVVALDKLREETEELTNRLIPRPDAVVDLFPDTSRPPAGQQPRLQTRQLTNADNSPKPKRVFARIRG